MMSVLLNVFYFDCYGGKEFFADNNKRFTQEKTIQSLTICIEEINQVKVNTIQMGIPHEDRVASGITGFPIVSFLGSIVALRPQYPQIRNNVTK